jgi:hypothetical protein
MIIPALFTTPEMPPPMPKALPPTNHGTQETALLSDTLRDAIDQLAIADESGVVRQATTKPEQFWRPEHPNYAIKLRAASAISAREKALTEQHHQSALEAVGQLLGAISTKAFLVGTEPTRLSKTNNDKQREALIQKIKTTGPANYRTAGEGSYRIRRYINRRLPPSVLRLSRSPEQQVYDEGIVALRRVGQMVNFEQRLHEIISIDQGGEVSRLVEAHDPAGLRHYLGELGISGLMAESSPFHRRWSAVMEPRNIRSLRQCLLETSSNIDRKPEQLARDIVVLGIRDYMRPRIVAAYLGISYEEWDAQRYRLNNEDSKKRWEKFKQDWERRKKNNEVKGEPTKVPPEVIDQIDFLIKLAGTGTGKRLDNKPEQPSVLDMFIDKGISKPWVVLDEQEVGEPIDRIEKFKAEILRDEREELMLDRAAPLFDRLDNIELELAGLPGDSREAISLLRAKKRLQSEIRRLGLSKPKIGETNSRGAKQEGELQPTDDKPNIRINRLSPVVNDFEWACLKIPQQLETDPVVQPFLNAIKQLQELVVSSNSDTIDATSLLPIMDRFDEISRYISTDTKLEEPVRDIILSVANGFQNIIKSVGLNRMIVIGEAFDPKLHDAVAAEGSGARPIVSQELQAGYLFKDHVIRPARVKVISI